MSETRVGARVNQDLINKINIIITDKVKNKGQSLFHVYTTHKDELGISIPTLYRLIDDQLLTVRNIDLRMKPKLKVKTYSQKRASTSEIKIKRDRSYILFEEYVKSNNDLSIVELDTVVGPIGKSEKVFFTFYFIKYDFLYSFLLNSKIKNEVTQAFNYL